MAQTFSNEMSGVSSTPVVKPQATAGYGARERVFRATITLASQAANDTIVICDLPAGYLFAGAQITTSVTLGTATLSMGDASSATAYMAATTFTTANVPVPVGSAAALAGSALTATDRIFLTVGTAALPASGTLVVQVFATLPN